MDVRIEQSWKKALQGEFEKPYFAALARYLHGEGTGEGDLSSGT